MHHGGSSWPDLRARRTGEDGPCVDLRGEYGGVVDKGEQLEPVPNGFISGYNLIVNSSAYADSYEMWKVKSLAQKVPRAITG